MNQKVNQKKYYLFILFTFLTWRIVLFFLGKVSDYILPYDPSFPYAFSRLTLLNLPRWIYSWVNFDGVHYLTIASEGYLQAASVQAFFPIFPILIRIVWELTGISFTVNGLIQTTLYSFVFFLILWIYLQKKKSLDINKRVFLMILFFPVSFFLISLYSEAFFLLSLVSAFYFFSKEKYLLTGLLIAIASATRLVGIFLIPAFWLELYFGSVQNLNKSLSARYFFSNIAKNWKGYFLISLGAIGLISYMCYLWINFHDPLYFFHVQSEFGAGRQEKIILLPQVIWRYLKILWTVRPLDLKYFAYVQEFLISLGFGFLLLLGWVRRKTYQLSVSELIFSSLAFLLPTMTGSFSSMPRYVLVCLPVFIILAHHLKGWKFFIYLFISGSFFFLNAVMFLQGYWVS